MGPDVLSLHQRAVPILLGEAVRGQQAELLPWLCAPWQGTGLGMSTPGVFLSLGLSFLLSFL